MEGWYPVLSIHVFANVEKVILSIRGQNLPRKSAGGNRIIPAQGNDTKTLFSSQPRGGGELDWPEKGEGKNQTAKG